MEPDLPEMRKILDKSIVCTSGLKSNEPDLSCTLIVIFGGFFKFNFVLNLMHSFQVGVVKRFTELVLPSKSPNLTVTQSPLVFLDLIRETILSLVLILDTGISPE